ncbi:hypothetical protein M426DRAFT_181474 [Hypoxylon sp. CI-4A]|nr:hypothetical protein M426DRAFT_181474 [Hypoxylon sp. CI-4A]
MLANNEVAHKNEPERPDALPNVADYAEKHVDLPIRCTKGRPPRPESIKMPESGEVVVHNSTSTVAKPLKPVHRKVRTFPISNKEMRELKDQSLDRILNNENKSAFVEPEPKGAVQEDTNGSHHQFVPGELYHLEEVEKQKLRRKMALPSGSTEERKQFTQAWELKLLPALEKILDEHVKDGYSINVRRGKQNGHRIIEIMTAEELAAKVRTLSEESKDEHLGEDLRLKTTMCFRVGTIQFLTDEAFRSGSRKSTQSEDWDPPINTRRYTNPLMGDSVGSANGGSGTMGPLLEIARKFYRLLNWHIFDDEKGPYWHWDEATPPTLDAYHPSIDDSPEQSVSFGKTVAYSGRMLHSVRASNSIQRASSAVVGSNTSPVQTVTDWVLVETNTGRQVNKVREVPMPMQGGTGFSESITSIADPEFGHSRLVYSTGRSSGYSMGQTCEFPASNKAPGGMKTRDWCVESTFVPNEEWNRGGLGVPGDSGAPVIDHATHKLLGQVWGRSRYNVSDPQQPPLTFFTAMSDIFDDIEERMPGCGRPALPADVPLTEPTQQQPSSPTTATANVDDNGRRSTLASISEHGDGDGDGPSTAAQSGSFNQRRSAARTTRRTPSRLSDYGSLPGLEPVRRWTMIAHAATF